MILCQLKRKAEIKKCRNLTTFLTYCDPSTLTVFIFDTNAPAVHPLQLKTITK